MIEWGRCWAITQQGDNCSGTFRLEGFHQTQTTLSQWIRTTLAHTVDKMIISTDAMHTTHTPELYTLCLHINSWASFPWHSHLYRYPQGTLTLLAKSFPRASPSLHMRWIASMSATIGQTSHRLDGIAIEPYYSMYHSCTVYTHHSCVSWHIS